MDFCIAYICVNVTLHHAQIYTRPIFKVYSLTVNIKSIRPHYIYLLYDPDWCWLDKAIQ